MNQIKYREIYSADLDESLVTSFFCHLLKHNKNFLKNPKIILILSPNHENKPFYYALVAISMPNFNFFQQLRKSRRRLKDVQKI